MRKLALAILLGSALSLHAAGPTIHVTKITDAIKIDGDLSDPGWQGAAKVDQWYETRPGDNIEPKAKSIAYLAYDDRSLYIGFDFPDPEPPATPTMKGFIASPGLGRTTEKLPAMASQ